MISNFKSYLAAKKAARREGFRCLQNQDRHNWVCMHETKH